MTHTVATTPVALPPLPPERLLAIARGLGRDAATWRALARHDPRERWFLQLTSNPRFDGSPAHATRDGAGELRGEPWHARIDR
jgi:hypothetical protein